MSFYYDDFLRIWKFDETEYDQYANPYYNIFKALMRRYDILKIHKKDGHTFAPAEMRPNYEKQLAIMAGKTIEEEVEDEFMMQSVEAHRYREDERKRPDLLIDEATKAYILENPGQNMFNLTLSNYPAQDSLFLGIVHLGSDEFYRC
jgi:hypothetical protein